MHNLKLKGFVFAQVPIWLLACADVDPQAKVIYAYLVWRQGQNEGCWPSIDRIASDLQVERKTVIRNLQDLEEKEYIQVHRASGRPNYYVINGEVPSAVMLSEPLAAELKIQRATTDGRPVPCMGLVAESGEGTSPIHGTGVVPSEGHHQSHPGDSNDIHERYTGTITDSPETQKNQKPLIREWHGYVDKLVADNFMPQLGPTIKMLQVVGRKDERWILGRNERVIEILRSRVPRVYEQMMQSCQFEVG